MADDSQFSRRAFLVRAGVLSAAVALLDPAVYGGTAGASVGMSTNRSRALGEVGVLGEGELAGIFDQLATDTINGLVAFVVPGPDPYSMAQGVADNVAGGIAADGTGFLLNALDNFFPVPQEPLRLLVQALTTGLAANLPGLPGIPVDLALAEQLDAALAQLLAQQSPVPLSLPVALLLNFVATLVNPTTLTGDFLAPFSRLTFAEKTSVFSMLEGEAAIVAALIDTKLSEPARSSISGVIEFLSGALLEFAAFGAYCEFGTFDAATRTLTSTPVGWRNTRYLVLAPANRPVEGWNEFKGYLGGVSKVSG